MRSGMRIPTAYFVTTGTGQSDEGVQPDPYYCFSYDLAGKEASIENLNVVNYTSVLPPESFEVPVDEVREHFHHGAVLESILAKACGVKGDTVAAGIGRVWAVDRNGKTVGGYSAEYEYVYENQAVSPEIAESDATAQMTKALKHELEIRDVTQKGEMKFISTSLRIEKKYGMAIALIGFVNYEYPAETPVKK